MANAVSMEDSVDPGIPIVDSHHHVFIMRRQPTTRPWRYLVDEYLESLGDEHDVVATVVVQGPPTLRRADGPENLRPVGETEFMNGQAAASASGLYGDVRIGAGIISFADLTLGHAVAPVLEAHLAAAPQRFRGIRHAGVWDEDESLLLSKEIGAELYRSDDFRRGFARLAGLGLTFDAFVLAPQLPDVADLAGAFPRTGIVLNHVGQPVGSGRYTGRREELFDRWRSDLRAVAAHDNVTVKLGGLGTHLTAFPSMRAEPPYPSDALAEEWRPWIETAIEAFGPERCMFESNLPMDASGAFRTVTNAYKLLTKQYSDDERRAIFAGTAARVYRLQVPALER